MAFKDVFMTYYVPLCNYANGIVKNDVTAEDVVQDVFTHLWKTNNKINLPDNMQAFLFTAVKNKAFEHIRNKKTYSSALQLIPDMKGNSNEEAKEESEKYMNMETLYSLLRHLPPKCKKVFALHRLNGLTYAEIADLEQISVRTVQNHMIKALKILRAEYSKIK